MTAPRRLISIAAALLTAVTLIACAGSPRTDATAAGPAPAPPSPTPLPAFDAAHPPVARGGPDGRSALDGEWIERLDPSSRGESLGWAGGTFTGRTVKIPYSPNAGTVRGNAGMRSYNGSVAWYRTTFTVASAGEYALRFESVNHHATVWVDGRRAGRHTGEYLPFDVPLKGGAGRHTVVVRADWRGPVRMKATGWHRAWFNFGGINREVTIRPLAGSQLDGPGIVTRLSRGGASVAVTVRVRNPAAAPRTVRGEGVLGAQRLAFAPLRLRAREERRARAVVRVRDPQLWAPEHPALTDLHLFVAGESGWTERVGLRELRWSGGRLRLNGAPLRLHGASIHEDAPGRGDALLPGDMDAIVQRLQAISANATREQHAVNPALFGRIDAAGLVVWQGVGLVDAPEDRKSDTPAERRRAIDWVRTSERQTAIHPSVLAWS